MLRQLASKCKLAKIMLVKSRKYVPPITQTVLIFLINVSSNNAPLKYSGQESRNIM